MIFKKTIKQIDQLRKAVNKLSKSVGVLMQYRNTLIELNRSKGDTLTPEMAEQIFNRMVHARRKIDAELKRFDRWLEGLVNERKKLDEPE